MPDILYPSKVLEDQIRLQKNFGSINVDTLGVVLAALKRLELEETYFFSHPDKDCSISEEFKDRVKKLCSIGSIDRGKEHDINAIDFYVTEYREVGEGLFLVKVQFLEEMRYVVSAGLHKSFTVSAAYKNKELIGIHLLLPQIKLPNPIPKEPS